MSLFCRPRCIRSDRRSRSSSPSRHFSGVGLFHRLFPPSNCGQCVQAPLSLSDELTNDSQTLNTQRRRQQQLLEEKERRRKPGLRLPTPAQYLLPSRSSSLHGQHPTLKYIGQFLASPSFCSDVRRCSSSPLSFPTSSKTTVSYWPLSSSPLTLKRPRSANCCLGARSRNGRSLSSRNGLPSLCYPHVPQSHGAGSHINARRNRSSPGSHPFRLPTMGSDSSGEEQVCCSVARVMASRCSTALEKWRESFSEVMRARIRQRARAAAEVESEIRLRESY